MLFLFNLLIFNFGFILVTNFKLLFKILIVISNLYLKILIFNITVA